MRVYIPNTIEKNEQRCLTQLDFIRQSILGKAKAHVVRKQLEELLEALNVAGLDDQSTREALAATDDDLIEVCQRNIEKLGKEIRRGVDCAQGRD
jgi:hypothetical protein